MSLNTLTPTISIIKALQLSAPCRCCGKESPLKFDGESAAYVIRCKTCGTFPASGYEMRRALMNVEAYRKTLQGKPADG